MLPHSVSLDKYMYPVPFDIFKAHGINMRKVNYRVSFENSTLN